MYELVEGIQIPRRVAGAVGLEICNTRAGWGQPHPREYLLGYDHLAVWARETGLVAEHAAAALRERAAHEPEEARSALGRTLAFRESLYSVLAFPPSPRHWQVVARVAQSASGLRRLSRGDGQPRWHVDEARAGLRLPLLAAGLAAADWLTTAGSASACPGQGCGWLFADPSGRRRWCSMAVCGNRAKVRRHAARARRPDGPSGGATAG